MIFLERGGGGGGGGGEFGARLVGLGSCGRLEMRRIALKAGETVTALYIFPHTTLGAAAAVAVAVAVLFHGVGERYEIKDKVSVRKNVSRQPRFRWVEGLGFYISINWNLKEKLRA
ncbi:hypothetical protein OIU77_010830 [Salix suchowensis]|uniref:Uncharacterized protein n=1 Tax=Salix suchowensis TaxID=1278906 RepID=A0ABQ9A9N2_9ROSI|nr:hypothetical protein OIU77_010830 [Salix suchowensis]